MAGWIKMPLGTEIDLGPGDFMLDGDPAALPKTELPIFGTCLVSDIAVFVLKRDV